jgi:uncharacterized membrane protein YedE/YeeE
MMTNPLCHKSWSPYVVGALIGVLSWFAFATADKPIGITTAFEHTAALTEKAVVPGFKQKNEYFAAKTAEGSSPKIRWEWMLVVGVFVGALISAGLSGDRTKVSVPPLCATRFGPSEAKRLTAAFISAALMMFGTRLAQGCTSGHGISGTLQLAVSSWMFISVAFGVAIVTALLIYGRQGVEHV